MDASHSIQFEYDEEGDVIMSDYGIETDYLSGTYADGEETDESEDE